MELPELQHAIRRLPGVASATMRWPDPDAPVLLRIQFSPGADRDAITEHVLDVVRRSRVIDQSTVEVERAWASTTPAETRALHGERRRPVLLGLTLDDQGLDVSIKVVLQSNGQRVAGQADGIAAHGSDLRAAAAATLAAVRHLLPGHVRVDLEWLGVTPAGTVDGAQLVQTGVTCLTAGREPERLYGSAPVRGDARAAAARATLDALNRRLVQLAHAS